MWVPTLYRTSLEEERRRARAEGRAAAAKGLASLVSVLLMTGALIVAYKTNPAPEDYVPHARTAMDETLLGPLVSWAIDAADVAKARGNLGICGVLRVEHAVFVGAFGETWRIR